MAALLRPVGRGCEAPTAVDGHDQPLVPELGHRPADSHPSYAILFCQFGLAGQSAVRTDSPGADLFGEITRDLVGYRGGRVAVDPAGSIIEGHKTSLEARLTCQDARLRLLWLIERLVMYIRRLVGSIL